MPNTTKGLPYPQDSDPVDVPGDIQALAEAVDTELDDYLSSSTASSTYAPYTVSINSLAASVTAYTLVAGDIGKLLTVSASTSASVTVPPSASVTWATGRNVAIAQLGAGQVTIVPGSGVTIRSDGSKTKINAQYSGVQLYKINTDEWLLIGNLAT